MKATPSPTRGQFQGAALLALPILQAYFAWRAEHAYATVHGLETSAVADEAAPMVSVVVPARDEEANLRRLLPSLQRLAYPRLEVLVVDDGSRDGTARVARELGAVVIDAGPLPDRWTGKSHACWVGASLSSGEWLLFTDADTWHAPASLARALGTAQREALEAVSLLPEQECVGFWESLLVPYAYQHYFAGIRPGALERRASAAVLFNGQYVLVRRATYERVGGHAAVRESLIEDAALGRRLKQEAVAFRTFRAAGAVRVRMYHGLGEIWEGFAKNSTRFLAADPASGSLTVASTILAGAGLPVLLTGMVRGQRAAIYCGALCYGIAAVALGRWQTRFGTRTGLALCQPLAATVFQGIALASAYRMLTRSGTRWKGRVYRQ